MWTKQSYAAVREWPDEVKRAGAKKVLIENGLFYIIVRLEASDDLAEWNAVMKEAEHELYWKKSVGIAEEPSIASIASILGRRGGLAKTEAKKNAARSNGKKGGRPKKSNP